MKLKIFLKSRLLFSSFYCPFLFINKTLRLNNLKTRTAMNAKISLFVIFVEAIIYLLLYSLHDCVFKKIDSLRNCILWHYRYFLEKSFKFQPKVCGGCHGFMQKAISFNDVAIVSKSWINVNI